MERTVRAKVQRQKQKKAKASKENNTSKQASKKQLALFWKLQSVVMVSAKFEAGSNERRGSWKPKGWPVLREMDTALQESERWAVTSYFHSKIINLAAAWRKLSRG